MRAVLRCVYYPIMNGFFDYARNERFPTQFDADKTAVTVDVLITGFILAFVMILICFYMIIPGIRGKYQAVVMFRVTLSLLIGGILMTSNFGQAWEVGEIKTRTPYKAGTTQEIDAFVGVKLGLRSVNVTLLQTEDDKKNNKSPEEKINYNERFSWTWDQGRFGFGPYGQDDIMRRSILQEEIAEKQLLKVKHATKYFYSQNRYAKINTNLEDLLPIDETGVTVFRVNMSPGELEISFKLSTASSAIFFRDEVMWDHV
ncbi:hypothetical protein ANN_20506 [Periplaneta americana]|uniref:Uncharacterized protein n=1 Tax=Periplaneta americana TaxID=6978 RepID=A0ABQ8SDK3_PERAM|nr:hypothetical protein ANN_20506 [Periplaneta americana]